MNERIKCPNCGSTAQVELIYADSDPIEKADDYACGCGCIFTVYYTISSIDIQE